MINWFKQVSTVLTWCVVVAPWEQALRIRRGKQVKLLTAGIYLRIPFIDRVYRQSVRCRSSVIPAQTITTRDKQVVTCVGTIRFSIDDLLKLFDTLEAPNDTIENEAASLVTRFVESHDLHQITAMDLEAYVETHLDLKQYGLAGKEFRLISFAAAKTYRFITGDLHLWNSDHDVRLRMAEICESPSNQG